VSDRTAVPFAVLAITDRRIGAVHLEALEAGGAVLFRDKDLPRDERLPLARRLRARTAQLGIPLIVHGSEELARQVGAEGVHLPASVAPAPLDGLWVGCSCHDRAEIERAENAGVDYITLSPVLESPDKGKALGWECFELWARASCLPVFALGGLSPGSLDRAREHGAWGVAGIRGFLSSG